MVSHKIPPDEMYMYIRRKFVYLKTTATTIQKYKKQFNLKDECYVFISKKDEARCKKPMIIYNNIRETQAFEKRKRELLARNKVRHGKNKCKITFSEKANAEFAFLIQNVEFTESKLRAAAREMKMDLHEFMAYYSHKKKLYIETKAKQQVVHSRNKHTATMRKIKENERTKKIPQSMQERLNFHAHSTQKNRNNNTHPTSDASEEEITVLHPGMLSKSGIFNSVENIHSFTEKIKSTKIATAPNENTENEFCKKREKKKIISEGEDLYVCPEVLSMGKIKQELRVCLTNIDMHLKKYSVQHTHTHTATKRKIEEKTRKVPQKKLSIAMPFNIEGNKNCCDNTHPPSDASPKEITVLHPGVFSLHEPGTLSNSVEDRFNYNFIKEKIESTKYAAVPSENREKEGREKKITLSPEREDLHINPEGKIEEDLRVSVANIDVEVKSRVQHTRSHTATKRKIEEETEKTRKIPRSLHDNITIHVLNTEKNKNVDSAHPPSDASEKELTLLHPDVHSFNEYKNKSVEDNHSFKEKIGESTKIAAPNENTKNEFCEKKKQTAPEDMEVKSHAQHTHSHTAAKKKFEGKTKKTRKNTQSLQKRVSVHMHTTERNKNCVVLGGDSTHTPFDASEKEITLLHPDVHPDENIHSFKEKTESTEIVTAPSGNTEIEFCKMKKEREVSLSQEREDLHSYPEELSGEDPYACAQEIPKESSSMYTLAESVCVDLTDMEVKSQAQHMHAHTAAKEETEGGETERTMEIPQNVEERLTFYTHFSTDKNKNDNLHPPSDASEKEITLLHPDENIHSFKEKTGESTEIATDPNENIEIEFCKKEEEREEPYVYACDQQVTEEMASMDTAAKRGIGGEETERTREIPQSVEEGLAFYTQYSTEKKNNDSLCPHSDASEKEIAVLNLDVLSFDETGKLANSVEEIRSFKEKIWESSEIAAISSENTENEFCIKENEERVLIPGEREVLYIYPEEENIQEDLHVCAQPVAEESADIYISAKTICLTNTDMQVCHAHHSLSDTATKEKIREEESEGIKEISQSSTGDRLSFHMYSFTEKNNKNVCVNTHPIPDSSDEEIKDIQHVFPHNTEIADASSEITENEFCKMKEDIIPEDTLQHYFSEKLVCIQEDLHTYIEESSEGIPEDPHVCANPAEESDVYVVPEDTHTVQCENVPDDDLGFLLPEDYVHDTLERERAEISGEGYFFLPLSESKQYEDISNDSDLSIPDDHTYDIGVNYAPSCSVEDKAPVLPSESINEFVSAHNVWANKSIVESLSAPTLSDFTVHPPFIKKKKKVGEGDKTVVFGTVDKVTVSLPSVYDSDEVIVFNENEWEEKNMGGYEISEYPSKQNYQYSNNSFKQIRHPPSKSVPKYTATSFYDMMSNEVLEDKILEK